LLQIISQRFRFLFVLTSQLPLLGKQNLFDLLMLSAQKKTKKKAEVEIFTIISTRSPKK